MLVPQQGAPTMTSLAMPVVPSLTVQPPAAARAAAVGPFIHDLVSPFQRTPTRVRVLVPET